MTTGKKVKHIKEKKRSHPATEWKQSGSKQAARSYLGLEGAVWMGAGSKREDPKCREPVSGTCPRHCSGPDCQAISF